MTAPVKSSDLAKRVQDLLALGDEARERGIVETTTSPPKRHLTAEEREERAASAILKKQAQRSLDRFIRQHGKQPEFQTSIYFECVGLIRLDLIVDDPDFANFRLRINPASLSELQASIASQGLRMPIVVVETPTSGHYHVRAGFKRVMATRNLGWETIPAIVLPADTPEQEEYWINIVENTAREKLSTYEIANAARMMRDRFRIEPEEFAKRSGYSEDHIRQLLLCIDRLPPEILDSWARGDRVPLSVYHKLSLMTHPEAIRNLRLWLGQHRIDAGELLRKLGTRNRERKKLLTAKGIARTQRLMAAVQTSKLAPPIKRLCLDIIEYCQGARSRIDGVVNDHRLKTTETPAAALDEAEGLDPELAHALPALPEIEK